MLVGMQTAQATMESNVAVLKRLKIELPSELAIPLLGIYPQNTKTAIHRNLNSYSSTIYNSQGMASAQEQMNES